MRLEGCLLCGGAAVVRVVEGELIISGVFVKVSGACCLYVSFTSIRSVVRLDEVSLLASMKHISLVVRLFQIVFD